MLSGQRVRNNEDGAASEELAKLGVVDVGGELRISAKSPIWTTGPYNDQRDGVDSSFDFLQCLSSDHEQRYLNAATSSSRTRSRNCCLVLLDLYRDV